MHASPFRPDLLKDKVALITGGGTGICAGLARAFGEHGAKLVLMGRRQDVLDQAVAEHAKAGIQAVAVSGDVREPSACEQAVAKAKEAFGRLDILVNGAAGNFLCPTDRLSPGGFRAIVEIDLIGTFQMCRAAYEPLKQSRGVILNISATLHYRGTPMQAGVMAAKAGIDALSRNLAVEWGPEGIRVVGIAPGPIGGTEGMRRLAPLGADKRIANENPMRRLGEITDIAHAACFLVSDFASYINGETLVVDGGQWLETPPFIDKATWEKFSAR